MTTQIHDLTVAAEKAGERLDLFVGHALQLSRARTKALFEEGAVRVDGRVGKKGQLVAAGQKIQVKLGLESAAAAPEERPDFPLTVLHEDEALVFVDKPSGVPSHPLRPGERGTLANALIARFPECAEASEDPREGGLGHRLDIETSGVMVAARSRADWEKVRAAFSSRDVDKKYWALVTGPIGDEGEIELPLRHHPRHPDRVEAAVDGGEGAREAVVAVQGALAVGRVLAGGGHDPHWRAPPGPRAPRGDRRADRRRRALWRAGAAGLGRFFLHARTLGLSHPRTGRMVEVSAKLPPELERAAEAVGCALPAQD